MLLKYNITFGIVVGSLKNELAQPAYDGLKTSAYKWSPSSISTASEPPRCSTIYATGHSLLDRRFIGYTLTDAAHHRSFIAGGFSQLPTFFHFIDLIVL